MCRNKYRTVIVPLPKVLANYQLVFLVGVVLFICLGLLRFFFANKSNINNFRYIFLAFLLLWSLTLSLWKCTLYSLGQEFLHESHPVHSRDLELAKITAKLVSFNRINTIYCWHLAQSSNFRMRSALGTGWSWCLKHVLVTHTNSCYKCTKLLRSDCFFTCAKKHSSKPQPKIFPESLIKQSQTHRGSLVGRNLSDHLIPAPCHGVQPYPSPATPVQCCPVPATEGPSSDSPG